MLTGRVEVRLGTRERRPMWPCVGMIIDCLPGKKNVYRLSHSRSQYYLQAFVTRTFPSTGSISFNQGLVRFHKSSKVARDEASFLLRPSVLVLIESVSKRGPTISVYALRRRPRFPILSYLDQIFLILLGRAS